MENVQGKQPQLDYLTVYHTSNTSSTRLGIVPLRATWPQSSRQHSRPACPTRLQPDILLLRSNSLLVLRTSIILHQSHPQYSCEQYYDKARSRDGRASAGHHIHQPEDLEHAGWTSAVLVQNG